MNRSIIRFDINIIVFCSLFVSFQLTDEQFEHGSRKKSFDGRRNVICEKGSKPNSEPLILTSLIESGRLDLVRCLSFVDYLHHELNIASFSGFFRVNITYNSNMFFWFFPHPKGSETPILLWSNGGPATSALEGLFLENGPFFVTKNKTLARRTDSWTAEYSVLYIDTPIGAGFSFTDADGGYSKDTEEISATLFSALGQFFKVFKKFLKADFYATAQSYGTKYMVSLGNRITGSLSSMKKNFKGVILLAPFLCPVRHFEPQFHHQVGLIDGLQLSKFESISKEMTAAMAKGDLRLATELLTHTFLGSLPESETILTKYTGFSDLSNILYELEVAEIDRFVDYLTDVNIRREIHVGSGSNATYHLASAKARSTLEDIPRCEQPALEALLGSGSRVFIVCGNLDAYVPVATWDRLLETLKWHHASIFEHTQRRMFYEPRTASSGAASGYVKCVANLCFAVIRNAGHLIPTDQPRTLLKMMSAFTSGNMSRGT